MTLGKFRKKHLARITGWILPQPAPRSLQKQGEGGEENAWKMARSSLGSTGEFHTGAPAPYYSVPVRGPSRPLRRWVLVCVMQDRGKKLQQEKKVLYPTQHTKLLLACPSLHRIRT